MIAAFLWAAPAAADLYRWIDPETGSVKFSSYPPPWYDESTPDRRMPKVERIPDRSSPKSFSGGSEQAALDGQRRAVMLMIDATLDEPANSTTEAELRRQMRIYRDVTVQLDRLDPAGAPARNRDLQRFLEKQGRGVPQ